ncbi:MAG: GNAT family N-acetyltransferase [Phycisphaerales bacterium]|nr:GNAT family N-acetyltransferase [Phycisphaerales bacterium]
MRDNPDTIDLVEVHQSHLDVFFQNQQDPEANELAKVFPRDRDDFDAHWLRIMSNPEVIARSIMFNGEVVGNINAFDVDDELNVGYWITKSHWGKGIATKALSDLLQIVQIRPIIARVAMNNTGSIRVLETNGFVKTTEVDSPATDRYAACLEGVYRLE